MNSPSIFDLFFIDIETVPGYPAFNQLPEEWKSLWSDKISKTMPENSTAEESWLQRAGIFAEFGKVICISTGYFVLHENGRLELRVKSIFGDDEKKLLQDFNALTQQLLKHKKYFEFCGHNIREFDIPYLCRRMLINGMELPPYLFLQGAKPWEVKMVDTLQWWKFGDYKNFISLNLLAHVLNIPTSKTDIDGSKVQEVFYQDHDLPRIVAYCQRDVVVVANIILRFKNMPILSEDSITIVS